MLKIILNVLFHLNQSYRPSSCLPNHCFCEALATGLIRQPINAYTNIAYVLVGIFVGLRLFGNKNMRKGSLSISKLSLKIFLIFALALVAVGVGSFLYHSGFSFLEQEFDDDSMYLIGSFLLLFSLSKITRIPPTQFLISYIVLNLVFEILFYFVPPARAFLFVILVGGMVLIEVIAIKTKREKGDLKYFSYGMGLFGIAFIFWIFDYTKIICFPNSYFQGHAIWHILTALAALMMYFFMESTYGKSPGRTDELHLMGYVRTYYAHLK